MLTGTWRFCLASPPTQVSVLWMHSIPPTLDADSRNPIVARWGKAFRPLATISDFSTTARIGPQAEGLRAPVARVSRRNLLPISLVWVGPAFAAAGTTLFAAENTGRICYGIELDPLYVDVIIRRYEAATVKPQFSPTQVSPSQPLRLAANENV